MQAKLSIEEATAERVYFGECAVTEAQIIEVLTQLPRDVSDWAIDNCRFVSVGAGIEGITLPGYFGQRAMLATERSSCEGIWIIVLADRAEQSKEDARSVIAHEVAHAWRGDDRLAMHPADCEIRAAELVKSWGFDGIGADGSRCHGTLPS